MIIIRVDGNVAIGMGHIMRCVSIANVAKEMGESCLFVLSSGDCKDVIIKNGHQVEILESDYLKMEPGDILPALDMYNPSAVFVDSYFVTMEYLESLYRNCESRRCKLIYVDDRCTEPYPCHILINYNIFAEKDEYKKLYAGKNIPQLMIGSSYTPLRREFQTAMDSVVLEEARNIFVSTGGSDSEHLAINLIEEALKYKTYIFHFVVGMMNPDKVQIKKRVIGKENIIIHENVEHMRELMRSCDVAISAAGSTLYELCATHIPTITYVIADNQIPAANRFSKKGIMRNCGDIRKLGNEALAKRLICDAVKLSRDFEKRKRVSKLMETVVDGNGTNRILEGVLN